MRTLAMPHGQDVALNFYTRTLEQRNNQRITHQQIASLKHADKKAGCAAASAAAAVATLFRDLASALQGGFSKPVTRHAMCDNYGHVADVRTWTEHLPKCIDCGMVISTKSQLRTAFPTSRAGA